MEANIPVQKPQPPSESESDRGCLPALVRLTWIFGGIALVYCAFYIAQRKGTVLTDLIMLLTTLGLIVIRFADIRFFKGETLNNQPATLKHWRLYSLKILIAAGLLYALAKFIAQKNLL